MSWQKQALEKLDKEYQDFKGNRYEAAMKKDVSDVLRDFCWQNDEFAKAVVQGGAFKDCMAAVAAVAAVAAGAKNALSDLEAYKRAAAFYFRGAQVKMELHIQLEPDAEEDGKVIRLDFADFFS